MTTRALVAGAAADAPAMHKLVEAPFLALDGRRVERLLIVRTDNIGDLVLSLPLAAWLRERFPATQISFLCRRYAAPLLAGSSAVDAVYEMEDALKDPTAFFERVAPDAVIWLPPGNRELARGAKNAGVPLRIGTSHRFHHWLDCNHRVHFSRFRSTLHEAQANFRLLQAFGLDQIPSLEELTRLARLSVPAHATTDIQFDGGFNLLIHPKSNGNGREWPLAHFEKLALLLARVEGIRLWVTGSAAEGELLKSEAPGLLAQPNVRLLCGSCDLGGLMKLMKDSQGMIASGTGPLHLAAALGIPALGLFPPRRPIHPQRWQPLGPRAEFLSLPGDCSKPCGDAGNCACMAALTPEMVADRVLQWHAAWQATQEPATV